MSQAEKIKLEDELTLWRLFFLSVMMSTALLCAPTVNKKSSQEMGTYALFEKFSGHEAGIVIRPGEIRRYSTVPGKFFEPDKLHPIDKQFLRDYMKDWKGEKWQVWEFKWVDTNFVYIGSHYSNDSVEASTNADWKDYDVEWTRDLKLKDKYLRSSDITGPLRTALVKAYSEADLNSDGRLDLVLVYHDTTGIKARESDELTQDCNLVIYENQLNGKYILKFKYSFNHYRRPIGKVEIIDVNKDNIPDVILWTLSIGVSGWSTIAEIFVRKQK